MSQDKFMDRQRKSFEEKIMLNARPQKKVVSLVRKPDEQLE